MMAKSKDSTPRATLTACALLFSTLIVSASAQTPDPAVAEQPLPSMAFERRCERLASDVLASAAAQGAGKTTAPRASKATPLQQAPYPPGARSRGEEGTVVMEIFVTETGRVERAHVRKSSGSRELDMAALQITDQWELTPGTVDGTPVCMWGLFAVRFSPALADQPQLQEVFRPAQGPAEPKHR